MKIDYEKQLINTEDEPYHDDKGNPLTLRKAIVTSCATPLREDEALSMVEKYQIGELAMLAHKGLDLTAEQIAKVKARIAKVYNSPLLVYILHEALENGKKVEVLDTKTKADSKK